MARRDGSSLARNFIDSARTALAERQQRIAREHEVLRLEALLTA